MSVDFDLLRRRLAETSRRLEGRLDKAEIQELLEARGVQLAEHREAEARAVAHHVFVVRRGEISIGLPVAAVEEMVQAEPTPLPHGTDVLQGLFHIRGHIYCLADLASLLSPEGLESAADSTLAVLLRGPQGAIGLRVDEVLGEREVEADECIARRPPGAPDFVRAMSRDLLHILDVEKLLSHRELSAHGPRPVGSRARSIRFESEKEPMGEGLEGQETP